MLTESIEVLAIARGCVQGVGFRYSAQLIAEELALMGYAKNLANGTVELCVQGEQDEIALFFKRLKEKFPQAVIQEVSSCSIQALRSNFLTL